MIRLTLAEAYELAESILLHNGFNQAHARAVSATVLAGERDGCASHGLYRVLGCVNSLRAGKVCADAVPQVIDQAPSIVRVDAAGGFSQLAFQAGLPLLEEKTRANGIAALAINRCVHFSALWVEIEQLTAAGLVAAAVACPVGGGWLFWPLRYLGEISYGLYLWHLPVLLTLMDKTPWRAGSLLWGTLAGTVVLAMFSWHAYEKPWLRSGPKGKAPGA